MEQNIKIIFGLLIAIIAILGIGLIMVSNELQEIKDVNDQRWVLQYYINEKNSDLWDKQIQINGNLLDLITLYS